MPSTTRFDPLDADFVADPYPAYAQLRREQPLSWYEEGGMWLVARHDDVDATLRDRRLGRTFTPKEPQARFAPWNLLNTHSMLELEPPEHSRLRGLVARDFTPRRVESLRPRIRAQVDGLLEGMTEEADLIADLAEPLPVAVIAELLGVPEDDRPLLRPWSNAIVALYEPEPPEGAEERAITAAREFTEYLRALIARRREDPAEDLLSALAQRDELSDDELVATAALLLNAGHEASVNALGNGVVALLDHPDQLARLRADPDRVPAAVEELLRFDTPLSLFQRTALEPVEVAGQRLEPGDRVGLLLGSANRDDATFHDPDTLDVTRQHNPHVGFGGGLHFCLGAPLARVELTEALAGLLRHFTHMELSQRPPRRASFQFRGYERVPLTMRAGVT